MVYMKFCISFCCNFRRVDSSLVKQESFQKLLHKQEGTRAEWEYPFAVAGVNISFMLIQMLDLQSSIFS
jgi:ELMO/CED-12 family